MKKIILSVIVLIIGINYLVKKNTSEDRIVLRFSDDGEFTIIQITDLHYGQNDENDAKNHQIQEKLLEYVKPDVAILTGDMVHGQEWDGQDKTFYQRQWKKFSEIFNKKSIPYAYVLGNHDHQSNFDYDQIAELDEQHPYSLFIKGEVDREDSASNYALPLLSGIEGKEKEITTILWILDSKDTGCKNIEESYGCVDNVQQNWVKDKSKRIQEHQDKQINGLSFLHIPTQEFMWVWNKNQTVGRKRDDVSCPKKNNGLFQTLKNYANTKAIYAGHDHNNDYKGFYEGVELVYGRKTGYGAYGPKGMQKGATVIKLKEFINDKGETDFKVRSYIIQEDGSILDEQNYTFQGTQNKQEKCSF